jgi:hypothetical protein
VVVPLLLFTRTPPLTVHRASLRPRPCPSPADVLELLLMKLYSDDIVPEEAFNAWKDENRASVPGKTTALINSVRFFEFLATAEEEDDDEEDSEVEEALKDVVRPNNKASLR